MRKIILLVIMITLISCSGEQEKEPNNSLNTAQQYTIEKSSLVEIKTKFHFPFQDVNQENYFKGAVIPIQGSLGNKGDIDCFQVNSPNGYYMIELDAIRGINGAISLYDPSAKKLIKNIDDFRKSDEELLPLSPVRDNKTLFCIREGKRDKGSGDAPNKYKLSFIFYQLQLPEAYRLESEPNDDISSANPLKDDEIVMGFFSPAINWSNVNKKNLYRETDWYFISLPSGVNEGKIFRLELSSVKEADSVITLYSSEGRKLIEFDNFRNDQGELTPPLKIKPGEKFFIRVHNKVIKNLAYSLYTLRLVYLNDDNNHESEPNNSMETANLLQEQKADLEAFLSHKGDIDFFAVAVNKDLNYLNGRIDLPSSLHNSSIFILDQDKKIIFSEENITENSYFFSGLKLKQGTYYLQIENPYENFDVKNSYRLKIDLQKYQENMEREPNNSVEKANPFVWQDKELLIGPSYLLPRKDKDYYKISTNDKKRKRLNFSFLSQSEANVQISITDRQGYILKTIETDGKQTSRFTETIDGSGYILIQNKEVTGTNFVQPYYIQIGR